MLTEPTAHCSTPAGFAAAVAATPDRAQLDATLAELRLALAVADADLLTARADEDRRFADATAALLSGLELGQDAGRWQPAEWPDLRAVVRDVWLRLIGRGET